ncbi:ArdC-like ssDNA-binding domain-containing protein [Octadecabacter antarcticus]|uniref:ArdC-like ssDNA-binding domain-containing protein n=1 Tax=Octadecabacter antarcticus TaxID=1217908 RepID=UPI002FDCC04D
MVESLEAGVRPWLKPWNAEHAAGKITGPLRHNGQPYSGINVFMLWMIPYQDRCRCVPWLQ